MRRHHAPAGSVLREITRAVRRAGWEKRARSHALRHSLATHLLEDGYDLRTIQERWGQEHVETTMMETPVLNRGGRGVRSPLDTGGGDGAR